MPYFDLARVEYHRHLGLLGTRPAARVRDARDDGRVPRAGAVRRPARGLRPPRADRPDERDVRVRGVPRRGRRADVTATQTLVLVDLDERKRRAEIPDEFREAPFGRALEARRPRAVTPRGMQRAGGARGDLRESSEAGRRRRRRQPCVSAVLAVVDNARSGRGRRPARLRPRSAAATLTSRVARRLKTAHPGRPSTRARRSLLGARSPALVVLEVGRALRSLSPIQVPRLIGG